MWRHVTPSVGAQRSGIKTEPLPRQRNFFRDALLFSRGPHHAKANDGARYQRQREHEYRTRGECGGLEDWGELWPC